MIVTVEVDVEVVACARCGTEAGRVPVQALLQRRDGSWVPGAAPRLPGGWYRRDGALLCAACAAKREAGLARWMGAG